MTSTADSNAKAVSGCGLENLAPYVIVAPFEATYSSVSVKLVLMRNTNGPSGYNGDWSKTDSARWTAPTIAVVPHLIDPTS